MFAKVLLLISLALLGSALALPLDGDTSGEGWSGGGDDDGGILDLDCPPLPLSCPIVAPGVLCPECREELYDSEPCRDHPKMCASGLLCLESVADPREGLRCQQPQVVVRTLVRLATKAWKEGDMKKFALYRMKIKRVGAELRSSKMMRRID